MLKFIFIDNKDDLQTACLIIKRNFRLSLRYLSQTLYEATKNYDNS